MHRSVEDEEANVHGIGAGRAIVRVDSFPCLHDKNQRRRYHAEPTPTKDFARSRLVDVAMEPRSDADYGQAGEMPR